MGAVVGAMLLAAPAWAQMAVELPPVLEHARYVESRHVGYGGVESEVWAAFDAVQAGSSDAELHRLLRHDNPVVRVYTSSELARREEQVDMQLLYRRLTDRAEVATLRGCMVGRTIAADDAIDSVAHNADATPFKALVSAMDGIWVVGASGVLFDRFRTDSALLEERGLP